MSRKLFEKGKSGNPGGRPKEALQFSTLARKHCPEAFQVLVDTLKSKNERHRIMAAEAILDRGYGKTTHLRLDQPQDVKTRFTVVLTQEKACETDSK